MSASVSDPSALDYNNITDSPQVSTVEQGVGTSQASMKPVQVSTPVPTNVFTGTLQGTLGFTTSQTKVLLEVEYDTQSEVLYWKFTDIKIMVPVKSQYPCDLWWYIFWR